MKRADIESKARDLQKEIWDSREALWPLGVPPLTAMFEPLVASRVLGYEYEFASSLGPFGNGKERFEIAGTLNRERRVISVSSKFQPHVMRFTGAHEIGHVLLHAGEVMHRDRPMYEMSESWRSKVEVEADYFAACYLAPAGLVRDAFVARFGSRRPLPLTDLIAWNLSPKTATQLMASNPETLEFAKAVAAARSFNGRPFKSLTEEFRISATAMAIRLKELGFVVD